VVFLLLQGDIRGLRVVYFNSAVERDASSKLYLRGGRDALRQYLRAPGALYSSLPPRAACRRWCISVVIVTIQGGT
jgi:hypothetical protein